MFEGFRVRVALAALLPATLGWLAIVPPPAAQAQEPEMNVRLGSITPVVTGATDQVTATGRVRNTGDTTLRDVKVSMWISENPLTSRQGLNRVASGDSGSLDVIPGSRLTYPTDLVVDIADELKPGEKDRFSVKVDVQDLIDFGLDSPGSYLVGVDVRGNADDTGIRHTWSERSFLPWVRDGESSSNVDLTPVELAFLLPLTAQPQLSDDVTLLDEDDLQPGELFADGGRLDRLLDLGAEYGLSYLVDPALLELAGTIQQGYRLSGDDPDGEADRQAGADEAGAFLDKARGLLAAEDALMLPYGDPDLPALQHNDLAGRYEAAIEEARSAATEYDTNPTELSWPGNGFATAGMLSTIAENGGETVLLRTGAVPERDSDTQPVVSLSTDEGSLTGLVTDPALIGGGPGGEDSGLQRRQRLLAETALVAMRKGPADESRRMMTTLPRNWDGSGIDPLLEAATGGEIPWLRQLPASALLSQPPAVYGGKLSYPTGQRDQELGGRLMDQLRQLDQQANRYLDLLADPQVQRGTVDREFLRAASMAWRSKPGQGNRLASEMTSVLDRANEQGVTILAPQTVTLSENQGRFPVTVSNDLDETIAVDVDVSATGRSGLKLEQVEPVQVPRWRKATASVTARAQEPGTYRVRAQLRTSQDGEPVGRPVTFQVRVTGFGQVGWAIIGAGVGLLVFAMVFRVVKRIRRRSEDGTADGDDGESSGTAADGTEPDDSSSRGGQNSSDDTDSTGDGYADRKGDRDGTDAESRDPADVPATTAPEPTSQAEPTQQVGETEHAGETGQVGQAGSEPRPGAAPDSDAGGPADHPGPDTPSNADRGDPAG